MKNKKVILISLGIIILFSLVTYQIIIQHALLNKAKTPEEEVARAFTEFKKALKERAVYELWDGLSSYIQLSLNNDVEVFKEHFERNLLRDPDYAKYEHDVKLDKVQIITPYRAWLTVHHPMLPRLKQYYMVKEQGKWKRGGAGYLFWKAGEDVNELSECIAKYYADKGYLPYNLSELVPHYIETLPSDPFSDEKENYHYDVTGDKTWRIYSIGFDSRDDLGVIMYDHPVDPYFVEFDKGDIVFERSI